jgi:hypothetical protein
LEKIAAQRLQRVTLTDFDEVDKAADCEIFPGSRQLGRFELAGDQTAVVGCGI